MADITASRFHHHISTNRMAVRGLLPRTRVNARLLEPSMPCHSLQRSMVHLMCTRGQTVLMLASVIHHHRRPSTHPPQTLLSFLPRQLRRQCHPTLTRTGWAWPSRKWKVDLGPGK